MGIPSAYGARITNVDRQPHPKGLAWYRVSWMVDIGGDSILHVARTLPGGDANGQVKMFDKTQPATIILNGRSQIIHVAEFEPDADDEDGDDVTEQMSYKDALDYAIFAINTFMYPDASDGKDVMDLELKSDDVIATLVDMREIVQGVS
jgi:hypothetical protein